MKPLKDRLAEAMRRRPELSQADIARACKVKSPSVTDWMNGNTKSMAPEPARLAAQLFGCDQNWLGQGIGVPNWHDTPNPAASPLPPSQPTITIALPVVLAALVDLPPARAVSVRAQLDQVMNHPEMHDDVLAELLQLLSMPAARPGKRTGTNG